VTRIRSASEKLLASQPAGQKGGFVIFDCGNDLEFVQFSLEPDGLLLYWPETMKQDGVVDLLGELGYAPHPRVDTIAARQYVVADDGIYAQFGRDIDAVETFTTRAFERIFNHLNLARLRAEVEL
jgi:hypothetical protein